MSWIDINMNVREFFGSDHALRKPGVLIEVREYDTTLVEMIGDTNDMGGACNDCDSYGPKAIVLRARDLNPLIEQVKAETT